MLLKGGSVLQELNFSISLIFIWWAILNSQNLSALKFTKRSEKISALKVAYLYYHYFGVLQGKAMARLKFKLHLGVERWIMVLEMKETCMKL